MNNNRNIEEQLNDLNLTAAEVLAKFIWGRDLGLKINIDANNNLHVDQDAVLRLLMDFQQWRNEEIPKLWSRFI